MIIIIKGKLYSVRKIMVKENKNGNIILKVIHSIPWNFIKESFLLIFFVFVFFTIVWEHFFFVCNKTKNSKRKKKNKKSLRNKVPIASFLSRPQAPFGGEAWLEKLTSEEEIFEGPNHGLDVDGEQA
jgi:hypothetical protein